MSRSVSIIIPHYGDTGPTLSLLSRLRPQITSSVLEIIVSDDASPIPFPETPGVTLVRREHNAGFGTTVNAGAARARGDLLLVLNSDLEVPSDFVQAMIDASDRFPRAVLSPGVVNSAGEHAWAGRYFPKVRHHAIEWLTMLARWRNRTWWHRAVGHSVGTRSDDCKVDWVIGAAMLIPKTEFDSIGGFDERFYMNAEEVDLQRRLRTLGVPSIALATPVVTHAGGGSTPTIQRRTWLVEARYQYARKWGGERRLRVVLGACSLINFLVNVLRTLNGNQVQPAATLRSELTLVRTAARDRQP